MTNEWRPTILRVNVSLCYFGGNNTKWSWPVYCRNTLTHLVSTQYLWSLHV